MWRNFHSRPSPFGAGRSPRPHTTEMVVSRARNAGRGSRHVSSKAPALGGGVKAFSRTPEHPRGRRPSLPCRGPGCYSLGFSVRECANQAALAGRLELTESIAAGIDPGISFVWKASEESVQECLSSGNSQVTKDASDSQSSHLAPSQRHARISASWGREIYGIRSSAQREEWLSSRSQPSGAGINEIRLFADPLHIMERESLAPG